MTIGKSQKNRDAVTDDVASLAPAECAAIRERASNGSIGPADYSFQGAKRGSVVRPGMAPYTMAPHPRRAVISSLFLALFLAVAVFCGFGFGPGQAQAQVLDDQSTETKIETNGQHRQAQVEQNYAVDEEDTQRVRRFRKLVPSALRGWLPEVRPQAHSRTPVLTFRHWMNERKRFPGVFLFCIFVGLLGTAFFPKQLATAGECCRSQFWTCCPTRRCVQRSGSGRR